MQLLSQVKLESNRNQCDGRLQSNLKADLRHTHLVYECSFLPESHASKNYCSNLHLLAKVLDNVAMFRSPKNYSPNVFHRLYLQNTLHITFLYRLRLVYDFT